MRSSAGRGLFLTVGVVTALALVYLPLVAAWQHAPDGAALAFDLGGARLVRACLASLDVALVAALVAALVGVLGATALGARPPPAAAALVALPVCLPPYVHALGWDAVLGLVDARSSACARWLHSPLGAGGVLGLWGAPIVAFALHAALGRMSAAAVDAARQAGGRRALARVIVATCAPAVLAGSMVVFALALAEPTVAYCYRLADPRLDVAAGTILHRLGTTHDGRAALLAAAPLVLVAAGVLTLGGGALVSRGAAEGGAVRDPRPARLRAPAFAGLTLVMAAPLVALALTATTLATPWATLGELVRLALTSAAIAAAAAGLAFLPAVVIAAAIARATRTVRRLVVAACLVALVVPAGLQGLGVLQLLNQPGLDALYRGPGIVIVAQAFLALPVIAVTGSVAFARLAADEVGAARTLGASPAGAFVRVALPRLAPGLAAALVAGALVAAADFAATGLVIPAGLETLPWRLLQLAHYGASGDLALAALVAAALSAALAATVARAAQASAARATYFMRRS